MGVVEKYVFNLETWICCCCYKEHTMSHNQFIKIININICMNENCIFLLYNSLEVIANELYSRDSYKHILEVRTLI